MLPDIVIVSHESAAFIRHAVASLPDFTSVVVVDNASSDGTADVAALTGAKVEVNKVNAGFAAAANQGSRVGCSDFILFLNPDAEITPDAVRRLCAALDAEPGVAVISARLSSSEGTEQRVAWPFPSAGNAWREALGLHRLSPDRQKTGFVIGACFLVRRSVFETLGGFDARYWLYGEDADFCRRAVDAGWGVTVARDVWAKHVGGASRASAPKLVDDHFERGGERFVADRGGAAALIFYRLANILGSSVRSIMPGSPERRALHRSRMARGARLLVTSPTVVPLRSPATEAPNALVVCSLERWDEVWRRNQFLLRELLNIDAHRRVLFVEPPFDWIHELRRGMRTRRRRRGFRSMVPDGRLLAVEPYKVAPRLLGGLADRSLSNQVAKAVERVGFNSPTLWINDVAYSGLLTRGWHSVYDVTDDWHHASASPRHHRWLAQAEDRVLSAADAVVVCSEDLADTRRVARPDLVLVPNGVDASHFTTPQARPPDLPQSPVVVYVGTLHEDRLDVELIAELCRALPEVNVALVGPNELSGRSTATLRRCPNLSLLGRRHYDVVPAYLQHADAIVIPHVVSPFTESLDPIKVYECLAVGRNTVATPVAGFREAPLPIRIAPREDFVVAVREALRKPERVPCSGLPSWNDRAASFAKVLQRIHGGGQSK